MDQLLQKTNYVRRSLIETPFCQNLDCKILTHKEVFTHVTCKNFRILKASEIIWIDLRERQVCEVCCGSGTRYGKCSTDKDTFESYLSQIKISKSFLNFNKVK